jgi:hypothetical protein
MAGLISEGLRVAALIARLKPQSSIKRPTYWPECGNSAVRGYSGHVVFDYIVVL